MIRRCLKCGFILGTKPGLYEKDGVCGACINLELARDFDWSARQADLENICQGLRRSDTGYDCVIAVSGGKDSINITRGLTQKYGLRPLLVTVTDEFTHTSAGQHNIKNIAEQFGCDHLTWRCEPDTFRQMTRRDFEQELHPLKWIEEKIYSIPVMIARRFGISAVFFGENSAFQYGSVDRLDYLHPLSDAMVKIYYYFAFEMYDERVGRATARAYGFKDLDDFNEWQRHGHIENFTQIDSVGYIVQLWTKYVKFGYQRVSDMACRFVRAGHLTRGQALQFIHDRDYQLDPAAKRDFCQAIGIPMTHFDYIVARHANVDLVEQDINGIWRLKE